jgi:hypothetical protein
LEIKPLVVPNLLLMGRREQNKTWLSVIENANLGMGKNMRLALAQWTLHGCGVDPLFQRPGDQEAVALLHEKDGYVELAG